jgi:hypothetical protein
MHSQCVCKKDTRCPYYVHSQCACGEGTRCPALRMGTVATSDVLRCVVEQSLAHKVRMSDAQPAWCMCAAMCIGLLMFTHTALGYAVDLLCELGVALAYACCVTGCCYIGRGYTTSLGGSIRGH